MTAVEQRTQRARPCVLGALLLTPCTPWVQSQEPPGIDPLCAKALKLQAEHKPSCSSGHRRDAKPPGGPLCLLENPVGVMMSRWNGLLAPVSLDTQDLQGKVLRLWRGHLWQGQAQEHPSGRARQNCLARMGVGVHKDFLRGSSRLEKPE
jgi:hypothetical protein